MSVQEVCRMDHDIAGGTRSCLPSVHAQISFANATGYTKLTSTFNALITGLMCCTRSGWLHCSISRFPRYGRQSAVPSSQSVSTLACSRSSLLEGIRAQCCDLSERDSGLASCRYVTPQQALMDPSPHPQKTLKRHVASLYPHPALDVAPA